MAQPQEYEIIELPSSLSRGSIALAEQNLSLKIQRGGIDYLLDVSQNKVIPSIMVGLIVHLYKLVVKAKGNLYIINADAGFEDVLRISNLEKIIRSFSSFEEYQARTRIPEAEATVTGTNSLYPGITRMEFNGILTGRSAQLTKSLSEWKDSGACYLLDFVKTEMIDSMALGLLLEFCHYAKSKNGRIAIVRAKKDISRILVTVEIDKTIPLFATIEEGLAFLKEDSAS